MQSRSASVDSPVHGRQRTAARTLVGWAPPCVGDLLAEREAFRTTRVPGPQPIVRQPCATKSARACARACVACRRARQHGCPLPSRLLVTGGFCRSSPVTPLALAGASAPAGVANRRRAGALAGGCESRQAIADAL